jgi:hypothetical protein
VCAIVFPLFDFDFGLDLILALWFWFLQKPSFLLRSVWIGFFDSSFSEPIGSSACLVLFLLLSGTVSLVFVSSTLLLPHGFALPTVISSLRPSSQF